MKLIRIFISSITIIVLSLQNSYGQMIIKEVKCVYRSKIDGRIISDKEFQSYRGRFTFHERIKGKEGAIDTILISPPKDIKMKASLVDQEAPDFNVTDIYGNSFTLDQLSGKVVVMNFWFVACPPCIKEIPELNELVNSYSNNSDVVFLAFAKDTEDLLGKFLAHTAFDYAIIPNSKDIAKRYDINEYPTHVIIDKNGMVRFSSTGFKEESINELKSKINNYLK